MARGNNQYTRSPLNPAAARLRLIARMVDAGCSHRVAAERVDTIIARSIERAKETFPHLARWEGTA